MHKETYLMNRRYSPPKA